MVSKKYLVDEIDALRALNRSQREDLERLERLVENLCEELGYKITYKRGLYLEPIEEDSDE